MVSTNLTEENGKYLVELARKSILYYMNIHDLLKISISETEIPKKLLENGASFVTLTINGSLRGCIGSLKAHQPLCRDVISNAVNAAFHDPRFPPLIKKDFGHIHVEISVLTQPEASNIEKIIPGKHGVIISYHDHSATFLPQVWKDLPDKKEFLKHLCAKADLPVSVLNEKETRIWIYVVQKFEE